MRHLILPAVVDLCSKIRNARGNHVGHNVLPIGIVQHPGAHEAVGQHGEELHHRHRNQAPAALFIPNAVPHQHGERNLTHQEEHPVHRRHDVLPAVLTGDGQQQVIGLLAALIGAGKKALRPHAQELVHRGIAAEIVRRAGQKIQSSKAQAEADGCIRPVKPGREHTFHRQKSDDLPSHHHRQGQVQRIDHPRLRHLHGYPRHGEHILQQQHQHIGKQPQNHLGHLNSASNRIPCHENCRQADARRNKQGRGGKALQPRKRLKIHRRPF